MNNQKELFQGIAKFVEDNKSLLKNGINADLSGLDVQIEKLCAGIVQLSPEDREQYADLLQHLLDELTILGQDLTVQKEALVHEIRYLSSHKKASVAYQVADSKANPLDKKEDE